MRCFRIAPFVVGVFFVMTSLSLSPVKKAQAQGGGDVRDRSISSSIGMKANPAEKQEGAFGGVRVVEPDKAVIPEGVEIQVPWTSSTPLGGEEVKTKPRHIILQKRVPMRNWEFDAPATPATQGQGPRTTTPPNRSEPIPKLRSPSHYPEGIQNPRTPWYEKGPSTTPRGATGR
jgi:hypothetical protein